MVVKLAGHFRENLSEQLLDLSRYCKSKDIESTDFYGNGAFLCNFEQEVSALFGKAKGLYFPSGIMAQNSGIRAYCDNAGSAIFAMHESCHLEIHEEKSYRELHNLKAILMGRANKIIELSDVEAIVSKKPAVVVLELPMRELGGQLVPLDEVKSIYRLLREHQIKFHIDGARIWEAAAAYGVSLEELGDHCDSIYVSFYKGIGAISGAMLMGTESFVNQCSVWRRRHGGTLITQGPEIVSAAANLLKRKERFLDYHIRAKELATMISQIDGIEITPSEPHTNMFHLLANDSLESLDAANSKVIEVCGIDLFGKWSRWRYGEGNYREITIGDCALELKNDTIDKALAVFSSELSKLR